MKYAILAAVTALVAGAAATAHAADPGSLRGGGMPAAYVPAVTSAGQMTESNQTALNALLADWDRAGFNPPSKPSQYRVYGRNGYVTNGPGYYAMVASIRSSVSDTQRGDDREAAEHIAKARSLLASIAPSTLAHTKA
jgi:hypothetical protein